MTKRRNRCSIKYAPAFILLFLLLLALVLLFVLLVLVHLHSQFVQTGNITSQNFKARKIEFFQSNEFQTDIPSFTTE